jgi:nicotinamidase/pyrazinamidase
MKLKKALLIVDAQNDFCPGGALGVKDGDKIISVINKYIKVFQKKNLPVFITRDWHPRHTKHFKQFGGAWPTHCIQNTKGAMLHPKLKFPNEVIILSKGMDPEKDSYSAFQALDPMGTDFLNLLKIFGVEEIFIGGLATDYCVRWTALDALKHGFGVKVLMDAIKGVDLKPGDSLKAINEIVSLGAKKITFEKLSRLMK